MASSDQGIGWLNDEVKTTPLYVQVFLFVFSYSFQCLLLHLSLRPFLLRFLTRNVVRLFIQLISLSTISGSCVLKASVNRVSVDTLGRYGDRQLTDILTDTQSICQLRLS